MPACTYLTDEEVKRYSSVSDKELDELLQELRAVDDSWAIQETTAIKKGFWKNTEVKHYTLYYKVQHPEWQVINLATPNGGSVFHYELNSREFIMNYIMGVLNGMQMAEMGGHNGN